MMHSRKAPLVAGDLAFLPKSRVALVAKLGKGKQGERIYYLEPFDRLPMTPPPVRTVLDQMDHRQASVFDARIEA